MHFEKKSFENDKQKIDKKFLVMPKVIEVNFQNASHQNSILVWCTNWSNATRLYLNHQTKNMPTLFISELYMWMLICDHNFQIASIIHNLKLHLHYLFVSNGPSKFILDKYSFFFTILVMHLVKSDSVPFLATIDLRNGLGLLRMCIEHIVKTKQNVCTWKQCYDGFKCIRPWFHTI